MAKFSKTKKQSTFTKTEYKLTDEELQRKNSEAYGIVQQYDEKIASGGYLSAEDLYGYKEAQRTYIDTGNAIRKRLTENGYKFTDADEAEWATQVAGLNEHYQLVYDTYSPYADETAFLRGSQWNWQWRQQQYEDNKKRIEELKAQRDNLIPQVTFNPDSNVPLPFYDQGYLSRRRELESQIAELEKQNAQYERGEGDWASKEVDDSYSYYTSEAFPGAGTKRDYKNPSLGVLSQTTDHGDRNQWYYDENGVYRDAYGNALETDEFGNWIDPRNADHVIEDKLGLFLNASEEERNRAAAGDWGINNVSAAFREGIEGDWTYLQDWEIDVYYAYLEESKEKAYQYLANMERELDRRRSMDEQGKWYEEYEKSTGLGKVGMNLMTVPANLLGGFGGVVSDASAFLRGEDINPYSTAHSLSNYTRTVRGVTAEDLSDVGLLGDFYTMGDLYGAGMSILDTLAASTLPFGSVLLASSAAEGEAVRLYQEGATNEQIAFGAAAAGAAELIFESLSLGNLEKIKKMPSPETLGQFFKTILVQGGVEASEEVLTEIANTVSNAFIMGAGSDWQKLVDEKGAGALFDKTMDALHAGISGFLSGGGTSTFVAGASVINHKAQVHKQNVSVGKTVMAKTGGVDALLDLAKKLNINTAKVKAGNASQVGQLYYAVSEAVSKQTRTALISKMKEKGVSEEAAEKVSGVATTFATGGKLTKPEEELMTAVMLDKNISGAMADVLLDKESPVRQNIMQLGSLEVSQDVQVEDGVLGDVEQEIAPEEAQGDFQGYIASLGIDLTEASPALSKKISQASKDFENATYREILSQKMNGVGEAIQRVAQEKGGSYALDMALGAALDVASEAYTEAIISAPTEKKGLFGKKKKAAPVKTESKPVRKEEPKKSEQATEKKEDMDGKTFLESSGEEVKSISVKRIGKDGAVVTVNGGTEASLRDVSFGDERTHLAYSRVTSVEGMTAEAANKILSNPKAERSDFIDEAIRAFQGGLRNDGKIADKLDYKLLTAAEAREFYEEGRKAAEAAIKAREAAVKAKEKAAAEESSTTAKKGGVFYRYDGQTIDQRKSLTKSQRVAVDFVKRLAKKFGSTFYFYESYVDENGNRVYKDRDGNIQEAKKGFYDPKDGSIHIDLNGDNILFTVSHELVHFIRDWSPRQFGKMADLVMEDFNRQGLTAEELIETKQAEYAADGIELTEGQAFEEVIAASLEGIMADGRVMEFLSAAEAKDKGLGAKIKKFFQDIGQLIRDTIDSYKDAEPSSAEGRLIRKMDGIYRQLQEAFAESVMDAGENFRKAENTTGEGGVRYAASISALTDAEILELIENCNKGEYSLRTYIPVRKDTPSILLEKSKIEGLKPLDNRPVIMLVEHVQQCMDDDVAAEDGKRGHALTSQNILDITKALDTPRYIFYQKDNGRYSLIVEYSIGKKNEKGMAIVDVSTDKNPNQMNGFGGGKYNILVTAFAPESSYLKKYVKSENNLCIYDRTEDASQRSSGSLVPSLLNESSSSSTLTQPETVVKQISSIDSDGNQLTAGQQSHFSKSQERDADRNLQVMYRGDSEEVTVYDRKKSKASNLYGRGFYYTKEKSHAGQYGIVRAFYLNTVNPLMPGQHNITKEQMLRFLEAIENDGEDYDLYNYGEGATAESVLETVWGKGDFEMLQDVSASAIGDLVAAVELFNKINGTTYDSIRLPTETVIFNSNQAKLTTNKNPTDHPDIRYSVGAKTDKAAQEAVERENARLREDVARLAALLKLQGKVTNGTVFTPSSVEAAARYLKKNAGAKGDTKALAKLLNGFYEYIATQKELTWEDVREKAKVIANWLMDHVEHKRSDYAQEILDQIRGSRIRLDESQKAEVVHQYGSYDSYRKSLMGSITLSKDAATSLDSWWQEMATMYPDVFDAEISAADLPSALGDIVYRLRNENSSALEYEHNRRWIEQDLIRDVYDSYWRVSNLRTVADRYAAQINRLRGEHVQRMNELRSESRQKLEQLKLQHRAEVDMIRRAYRDRMEKQRRELSEQYRESRQRATERRKASDVRGKIKRLKAKMQSTLLNPSEKNFVPVSLFEAIVSVLELVDDNTELYKPDGTINQAQAARDATYRRLNKLKDLYGKLDKTNGGQYKGEFDEYVAAYLDELFEKYEGRSLAEMGLEELGEMYEILKSIQDVIMDARKLIGMNERYDVYEAADAIAAEQQAITDGRKNGKRNFVGIANDTMNNHALSPMRNIERMAGYDEDSMLVKLFREIEKGVRKGNLFMMRAYKMFEELTASPEYDDALYKEVTVDGKAVEYTDYKGRKFGLSKMQMMQAILSYEREQAVDNLNHIATGGFTFADLRMLRKGKLKEAISEENSHRVPAATEMVLEFIEILKDDKWCQDYMAVAREFFNHMAKDAINEASIATKHRAVATGEAYVPFETDQNFVVKEISAANDVQQTINSYGMLKDTQNNAPQPLIVTGLNNLIERHISQVGTVYGLAVPIRNFNKVWTTKTQPGVDGAPTVRGLIEGNWGTKGAAHIEQAVQDVQGPRKRDQGVFADLYRKLKSNYIGATFLFNLSVVMKQLGSLFTATSMIQWRNPVSMMANLIYAATHFQQIAAEVDQYTASVWMRRQGLSDAELSTLMTEGQKTWLGKLAKKGPAWANPTKWITGMDSAVALSLWRYCKEDVAARTGLEGEALLEATAEFFDDVVENTQSMTDVLHRPEIQKNTNIFSEPFAMFKTDVYQMAGQLNVAAGRAFANPTKENKRALSKTVYSIAMSAVWGQLMTAAFAALRYKMDRYKDDEDELTWKSFLKRSLFSLGGDLAGYVFPIFGSEIVGIGEALAYGETDDFLDNMTMSNVNELYSMIISISNAMIRGKEVSPQKWNKLIAKALQLFGVPTSNIIRLWEAIRKHATDIAEGEFFAFNEE